jgi:hypothetical protein
MNVEPYFNGKMEIPERIVVKSNGEIYWRDDDDNLTLLPVVKGWREINYDECVVIDDVHYKIKELVYVTYGEKCPYNHCVSQITKRPEGMNKNDIRNLLPMTWREIWGWSSYDISAKDKEINKIIKDDKIYESLLRLKPLVKKEECYTVSVSSVIPLILKSFKNCDLDALSLLLEVVKEDKDDVLAKSIPLILSTFRYNGKWGRDNNCDVDSLGMLLHIVKRDKSDFISEFTPIILERLGEFDADALKIILDLMKLDDDPSRLFEFDEEYKKSKPSNDFKGIDWIIEQKNNQ